MTSRRRMIVGCACGVLAVMLVLVYAAQVRAEAKEQREAALARYGGEQVEVCVASRDIVAGEVITASNMEQQLWLSSLLPADCITSLDEVLGQKVGQTVLANEPLSRSRLESSEQLSVPQGLCAVSVPASDVGAVGGAIKPGFKVDVYAQTDAGSKLLGSGLLVLATSSGGAEGGSLSWVTLAVTPESVEELLSVSQAHTLSFVLPGQELQTDSEAGE